jgi:hypothetical protein
MGDPLPTGLAGASRALQYDDPGGRAHDRLTSALWFRVLTDDSCPKIGGHDPRTVLEDRVGWEFVTALTPAELDVFSNRLNEVMGCGE